MIGPLLFTEIFKMASHCYQSSNDFHQACLNELARSLTRINRENSEKVNINNKKLHAIHISLFIFVLTGKVIAISLPSY